MDSNKINETCLEFIFLPEYDTNLKLKAYLEGANIDHDFNISKIIVIPNSSFQNEYYTENLTIFTGDKEELLYTFKMIIYNGITNYVAYDTTENNLPSIEMLFFSKKGLPISIKYKNMAINNYETKDNKYRRRFFISNANINKLEYINRINTFKFDKYSYQALIRIPENDDIKYSLSLIKDTKNKIYDKEEIKIEKKEKELLSKFYEDFNIFIDLLFELETRDYNDETEEELLSQVESLNKLREEITNKNIYSFLLNPLDFEKVENSLELIHYYHYLCEFTILYNNNHPLFDFNTFKNGIYENNENEKNIYNSLNENVIIDNEEKIKILQTITNISAKSIKSKNIIRNFSFVNESNLSSKNPYYKAIQLVKDIIDHLNEDSRLFELFLSFDSGTINNILEKNEIKDYSSKDIFGEKINYKLGKYKTEFGLSLLNVKDVQSHLQKLIPKTIIRAETNINFKAYYDKVTNIMIINELLLFNQSISTMDYIYQKKDSDAYVIPITMEILHELMSHAKVRLNDENEISPRNFRDSKSNFEYKNIKKNIELDSGEYKNMPISESGRILEYFISENKQVINSLKTPSQKNIKFINYLYWVGPNFNELENEVLINNDQNSNENTMLVDSFDNEDIYEGCYFDRSVK